MHFTPSTTLMKKFEKEVFRYLQALKTWCIFTVKKYLLNPYNCIIFQIVSGLSNTLDNYLDVTLHFKKVTVLMKNKIFFLNLKSYLLFEILIKTIRPVYEYSYKATVILCIFESDHFSND